MRRDRWRLDSSTAIISRKYHARKESIKLRAADYVERNDYAKRDGEVLVEASKRNPFEEGRYWL